MVVREAWVRRRRPAGYRPETLRRGSGAQRSAAPDAGGGPDALVAVKRTFFRETAVFDISVAGARSHGYSWQTTGALLGTTGEAARQRDGASQED